MTASGGAHEISTQSPGPPPAVRGPANRSLVFMGFVCLVAPFFGAAAVLVAAPVQVDRGLARFGGTSMEYMRRPEGASDREMAIEHLRWGARMYAQRAAIAVLVCVYAHLARSALLAGVVASCFLMAHVLSRRAAATARRTALGAAAVLAAVTIIAVLFGVPAAPGVAVGLAAVYLLNFPLPGMLEGMSQGQAPPRGLVAAVAASGLAAVPHLFAPSLLLAVVARCLAGPSPRIRWWAVQTGRTIACLVSLPLIGLAAYSAERVPLSPDARLVADVYEPYQVIVDRPRHHLIVTERLAGRCLVLDLASLKPVTEFPIPSLELEDIALDPAAGEIYHVDRASGTVFVIDAESFRIVRSGRISDPSSAGSVKLVADPASGSLLVSFEDNNLFMVDARTLRWTLMERPGNVNMIPDPVAGLVYVNSQRHGWVVGLDLKQGRLVSRSECPPLPERMALSEKRRELYAPDATDGTIWVYSTPDLRLLRKMPAQWGVRAVAVDDPHGLLFSASVVTGYLEVTEIETGRCLKRSRVGPYARIIALDPATRRAFITLSHDGLCVLDY